jgi:TonB family protein
VEIVPIVEPAPPENKSAPARIADIAEPAVQQKPKDPKFLGMYDSAVPQEMVGASNQKGSGGEPEPKPKVKPRVNISTPKKVAQRPKREGPKDTSKDRLFAFNKEIFDSKEKQFEPQQDSDQALKKTGSPLDDFYPDFRRGAHTYLNVMRYPGVEYFVRMKHAFKITFNPEPSLSEFFTRNTVTRGQIEVVLGVCVNRSGELAELFVFRASGIPQYDQEALRTVRASAPFSSPPEKFLADDGVLRMSWTLTVYL